MVTPKKPESTPDARLETLSHGKRPCAQLALLPARAVNLPVMSDALTEREAARAAGFRSERRREEFTAARWLCSQLPVMGPWAVSHCRQWIAAATTPGDRLGVDVESRLPRHVEAVSERLGWQGLDASRRLQAWSLWEAWRKLEGGSVLDAPDAVYARLIERAADIGAHGTEIDDALFWSLPLAGAWVSVAVRFSAPDTAS